MTTRLVKRCGSCGTELTSHGKATQICRACYMVKLKQCITCGVALGRYAKAIQCRACWKARGKQPDRLCVTCGKRMSRYSSPALDRCKSCRAPVPRSCVDCGKELAIRSVGPRCWNCHTERRVSAAMKKACTIEGCANKHVAKGLCAVHYEHMRRRKSRDGKFIDPPGRIWVAQQPCQLCGYSRLRSQVHRIIAQGNYEFGNMTALCARCHVEVHRGITPCPTALDRSSH